MAKDKIISDKSTKSAYVPGSLYKKMESKKVNFKETDNTKEELDAMFAKGEIEWLKT